MCVWGGGGGGGGGGDRAKHLGAVQQLCTYNKYLVYTVDGKEMAHNVEGFTK